jgi:hypothetical protein
MPSTPNQVVSLRRLKVVGAERETAAGAAPMTTVLRNVDASTKSEYL